MWVDTWVLIVYSVILAILMIHTIFGDLLGKIFYNHFKKKIEKNEDLE